MIQDWYQASPLATAGVNGSLQFRRLLFDPMDDAKFGFSAFAEQWNGRLAMMGFIIGVGTELFTGQGILSQIGIG